MSRSRPSFFTFVKAAFNARPRGMFVPPNWVGLAAFGLLGVLNPGFWLVGLGVELAYLLGLASHSRFQEVIRNRLRDIQVSTDSVTLASLVEKLSRVAKGRHSALEDRCARILDHPALSEHSSENVAQTLDRLLWVHLHLLLSHDNIVSVLQESGALPRSDGHLPRGDGLEVRIEELQQRLTDPRLDEQLRRSLEGQLGILKARHETQRSGQDKLALLDAELQRIEEQVELAREQTLLLSDPTEISARIDAIGETMNSTTTWMRDQQLPAAISGTLDNPVQTLRTSSQTRKAGVRVHE